MSSEPSELFKIVTNEVWERCRSAAEVERGTSDDTFIHLAEKHQVERIAKKFFGDHAEVMVLTLDPSKLEGRLVKEANPGGSTEYYHLYDGRIPLSAVTKTERLTV